MPTDQVPPAWIEYQWLPPWNPRAYAAPGTPGVGGYMLAVAVSLLAFALEIGLLDLIKNGADASVVGGMLLVLIFGCIPAALIGSVGAALVHIATWRASTQWPAILTAAGVGFVFPLLWFRANFSWDVVGFGIVLGLAAGVGRWAVVPFATRRGRR